MIELPWKPTPMSLEACLNEMSRQSERVDTFAILLHVSVYEHIKKEGINAKFSIIPTEDRLLPTDMVWVLIQKYKENYHA